MAVLSDLHSLREEASAQGPARVRRSVGFLSGALNCPIAQWRDKSVWVVGASSGIGEATAKLLHQSGARVVVSARNAQALASFEQAHPASKALPVDVTDAASVKAAAAAAQGFAGGAIDFVLYCAGHYQAQKASSMDLAQLNQHLAVNYTGALYVLDAVLPAMLAKGRGHISLVGSVAGYRGLPNALAYGPTKAALNNLADNLYLDLQPAGLDVSIVNPGFVETPLTSRNQFHMPALITPDEAARQMLAGWAKGRYEIHFPRRFTMWLRLLRHLPDAWYFAAVRRATGL